MAFSNNERAIIAEKLLLQLSPSSPNKFFYNELHGWFPVLSPSKLLTQFDLIPGAVSNADAVNAANNLPLIINQKTQRLTVDLTSNYQAFLVKEIFGDMSSKSLENWIQPSLKKIAGAPSFGYSIELYHGDPDNGGTKLNTTYHSGGAGEPSWEFIYSMGILIVSQDEALHYSTLYNNQGLWIKAFQYVGETGLESIGSALDDNFHDNVLTTETINNNDEFLLYDIINNEYKKVSYDILLQKIKNTITIDALQIGDIHSFDITKERTFNLSLEYTNGSNYGAEKCFGIYDGIDLKFTETDIVGSYFDFDLISEVIDNTATLKLINSTASQIIITISQ